MNLNVNVDPNLGVNVDCCVAFLRAFRCSFDGSYRPPFFCFCFLQVSARRGGTDVRDVHAAGGDRVPQPSRRHHDQRVHRGKERSKKWKVIKSVSQYAVELIAVT